MMTTGPVSLAAWIFKKVRRYQGEHPLQMDPFWMKRTANQDTGFKNGFIQFMV